MGEARKVNWWAVGGGAVGLWLGLQVVMVATGSYVLSNMVIRATAGLMTSLFFAARMGRLTEARWGVLLALAALFNLRLPLLTEFCIVGYFVWASCRLAKVRADDFTATEETGEEPAGAGAKGQFFLTVRLWSFLLWGLLSFGVAFVAGVWGGALMGHGQTGDKVAWETTGFVLYGMLLFWLLQKLEKADLDMDEFIGRWPGARLLGEGLLFATAAVFFSSGVSYGLVYAVAVFDAGLAESILKSWAWQPPPTIWRLEQFLEAVIIAPLVEELTFRGLVLRRLAARWGSTTAIIVSSVVFGALHVDIVVQTTIAGLAMALLYVRSQSLIVPIMVHMVNNLIACMLTWYYPEYYPTTLAQLNAEMGWIIPGFVLSIPVVAYYCYKHWPRRRDAWPMVSAVGMGEKV